MNPPLTTAACAVETTHAARAFEAALAGTSTRLQLDDGRLLRLPVHRWHSMARGADHWMLERCHGPTIDLGCGPGRLVAALLGKGIRALGIDACPRAAARGVPVLLGDIFGDVPEEGRWRHAILADGNIGIGGDPVALLRRTARMLHADGRALVEVEPAQRGLWTGTARVRGERSHGPWFHWAILGADAIRRVAHAAGMAVVAEYHGRQRGFVELCVVREG